MENSVYEKLIIHNLNKIPDGLKYYDGYEACELDEYDFQELLKFGVEEIWYWYAVGSYEGDGKMILRKGELYEIWYLGHCSCYGATDRQSEPVWRRLEEIKTSEGLDEELKELFDLIKIGGKE